MRTNEKIMLFAALTYAAGAQYRHDYGQGKYVWAGVALLWQFLAAAYAVKSAIEDWRKP
jgi:hypothetical protein